MENVSAEELELKVNSSVNLLDKRVTEDIGKTHHIPCYVHDQVLAYVWLNWILMRLQTRCTGDSLVGSYQAVCPSDISQEMKNHALKCSAFASHQPVLNPPQPRAPTGNDWQLCVVSVRSLSDDTATKHSPVLAFLKRLYDISTLAQQVNNLYLP